MRRRFVLAVVVLLLVSPTTAAQVRSPSGTWKLNLSKATYPAGTAPREQVRTYAAVSNGWKVTVKGIDAAGNKIDYSYEAKLDGRDYPLTGAGTPADGDSIALRSIDSATYDATVKKGPTVVFTARSVVSKDGQALTITATNAATGTKVVQVFDRQA